MEFFLKTYGEESKKKKQRRQKKQIGGWLNRYDFAYAGRDSVNQAFKNLYRTAPRLIKNASGEVDKVLEQRISQVIRQGGAEVQRIAPGILRGAIEEVYKTPFRLLGKFGKRKLAQVRKKDKGSQKIRIQK